MTTPTPQRKAGELIDSINQMLASDLNDARLDEIVSDANKLKEIGHFNEAYTVLGMVAALRVDIPEVDRLFNAAIKCSGGDLWTIGNYASALNNLHRHIDAIRYIDEVVDYSPDNLAVLYEAIGFHREAFDVSGVRDLLAQCEALGKPYVDPKLESELSSIENVLTANNVTWVQLSSRIELASRVAYEFGVKQQFNRRLIKDGMVFQEFGIIGDIEMISKVENAINDVIAKEHYSSVDDILFITCSKHEC